MKTILSSTKTFLAIAILLFLTSCAQDPNLPEISNGKSKDSNASMSTEVPPAIISTKYYYTRISETQEYKLKVEELSDGTYDVYVTTQSATHPVSAYFPASYVDQGTNQYIVNLPQGTYSYLKADDEGIDVFDNSVPAGGTSITYTCPCCSGSGSCNINGEIDTETGKFKVDCAENSCVSPGDGTVTCELKSSGELTGGGILFETAPANIRLHY